MLRECTAIATGFRGVAEGKIYAAGAVKESDGSDSAAANVRVVVSISSGKLVYRARPTNCPFTLDDPRIAHAVCTILEKRLKLAHPRFFLGLMNREMDAAAIKDMPSGFWKNYWKYLKRGVTVK